MRDWSSLLIVIRCDYTVDRAAPVKIINWNGRLNAVLGVRMLQNRSNGLNDVLISELNIVIVLNDVHSLQEDGTAVYKRRFWHLNVPAVNQI